MADRAGRSVVVTLAHALLFALCSATTALAQQLPSFPGADGFGAVASGGRGGAVFEVTRLDPDPAGLIPGSLNHALRQPGPRTVVFRVSGVIHGVARIVHGNLTLAGHTSPGGITVRGIVCDGHYERDDCSNLIIRHLRSRPAWQLPLPAGGERLDDGLRLDGTSRVMLDHLSIAHALDEAVQISWVNQLSLQDSVIAETVGEHASLGGMLINYSHPDFPQDALSIQRNLWYRIGGRLPEISCESSGYPDQPATRTQCQQTPLRIELANNLYADPGFPLWYTRFVDDEPAHGPYRLQINMIGNRYLLRPAHPYGIAVSALLAEPANALHLADNRASLYSDWLDAQLFWCCNDFPDSAPNADPGLAQQLTQRHPFPALSQYRPSSVLQAELPGRVGALPSDPMDRRIAASARSGVFPSLDYGTPVADDAFALDFDPARPPPPPIDSDADGMPDSFESQHAGLGLNPLQQDHTGSQLSLPLLGTGGYDNLEVYLHLLAMARVDAAQSRVFGDGFEG
jgi:pectate lyase